MFVYKITNISNGKVYVGKTINSVESRWYKHVHNACIEMRQSRFYSAIRKYGRDGFVVEIIETIETCETDLNVAETEWIARLNTTDPAYGYNMTRGGDGGHTNGTIALVSHAENRKGKTNVEIYGEEKAAEISQYMSESMLRSWKENPRPEITDDTRQKISDAGKALWADPVYAERMTLINREKAKRGEDHPMYGKTHSPEARQKMSRRAKGRKLSDRQREMMKARTGEKNSFFKSVPVAEILEHLIACPSVTMAELAKQHGVARVTMGRKLKEVLKVNNIQTARHSMGSERWVAFLKEKLNALH